MLGNLVGNTVLELEIPTGWRPFWHPLTMNTWRNLPEAVVLWRFG